MDSEPDAATATRRNWVVLLYFYAAALVGLGFVIVGMTTALFGLKALALPEVGLPAYTYESPRLREPGNEVTEAERVETRQRAIAQRRSEGADDLLNGAILVVVGTPTLVWHLRRGRRLAPATERPQ